jgi:hypothetical protein
MECFRCKETEQVAKGESQTTRRFSLGTANSEGIPVHENADATLS